MKVKAKRNVQDASGWHRPGDIFWTEENLGSAVEVLDAPKQPAKVQAVAEEKTPEPEPVQEVRTEPAAEERKPRASSRRKR